MIYVVTRPSSVRPEQTVYLSSVGFRDGSDTRRRNWVKETEHATHYKTRKGAERAAKSWGGTVEELSL